MRNLVFLSAFIVGGALLLTGCGDAKTPKTTDDSSKTSDDTTTTTDDSTKTSDDTTTTSDDKTDQAELKDIVDTAVAADDFTTLVAAVKAAELVDTLKGAGPFTLFAPTDEAFAKLPAGTLDDLLKPENKARLTAILTYHVVPGKVMAADVVKLDSAKTVQGGEVAIATEGESVTVDGANVTATDIQCTNGVIHIIDKVILPKE